MRKRILRVALVSVTVAVLLLGIPLAFAAAHILSNGRHVELERLALQTALTVGPSYRQGDPIELQPGDPGSAVGVYSTDGTLVAGRGPHRLGLAARPALHGSVVSEDSHEQLVAAVPVVRAEQVVAVVRAAASEGTVELSLLRWLGLLAAGCLLAGLVAAVVAAWQSRRLAVPMVELARSAHRLGDGDFSVRQPTSGVVELDAIGGSLNRTAERLGGLIDRERAFSAHASHQLRTPLTQLRLELELGLEAGGSWLRQAASAALVRADQLSRTIDDVLALARATPPSTELAVEPILDEAREHWQPIFTNADRSMRVDVDPGLSLKASEPAVRQVLAVLLDNALRHGAGAVTLRAREAHGAVALDVIDEGHVDTLSLDGHPGLGLSLARTAAVAEGGRLVVDLAHGTRVTALFQSAGVIDP